MADMTSENPQPLSLAEEPLLPGLEEAYNNVVEVTPAESTESAPAEPMVAPPPCPAPHRRRTVLFLAPALLLGAAVGFALSLTVRPCAESAAQPVAPAAADEDTLPLALLPETAEPDAWSVVSKMSGEIDGRTLTFNRGIAEGDGRIYRLDLDFCRSGTNCYARVICDGLRWVVRTDADGRILRAYPSPLHAKPLRDLFSR